MKTELIIVALLFITFHTSVYSQKNIYRTLFTSRSAEADTTIIGGKKSDEESKPRAVYVDINTDGIKDIFRTTYENCSSGGCKWKIIDGKTGKKIGDIKGSVIYILKNRTQSYFDIETYWKSSGNRGIAYFYSVNNGKYVLKKSEKVSDVKTYFANKPQFTKELEVLK